MSLDSVACMSICPVSLVDAERGALLLEVVAVAARVATKLGVTAGQGQPKASSTTAHSCTPTTIPGTYQ